MSKNKQHRIIASPNSPDLLEHQAGVLFEQEKFRQARELYKELVKIDRSRYFDQLIACYQGQAQQYSAKAMFKEAEEIFKQIEILIGQPQPRPIQPSSIASTSMSASRIESTVDALLSSGTDHSQSIKAADEIVLAFSVCEVLRRRDSGLHMQLESIFRALELAGESRFDEALQAVSSISLSSPFAH